ncbi:hypothetical protein [Mesorhizobium sp.]|uniref:hypothetical protein n=1 Tax=Mesorhizobium sp. TaxID=1871066 RepID=UPI000FE4DF2A|nr:hypothetical protein [Mesorhizobium sp.]RWE78103.1 MAG: hypothetical protein EOS42_06135 [Mesorhizobium sp.]TIV30357.1 MAG: hypothetical protein E5V90_08695 [Mesorhizobium sp.]
MTEIEVDSLGTYRLPNEWQYRRLGRMRGEKRHTAVLAFGCGMTVRQFAKLPPDGQQAVHGAYLALTFPPEPQRPEPADNDTMVLPAGHWPLAFKIKVGCRLMHMKETLPRGHFGPWVDKQPGLTSKMAQQCMALARDARQRAIEARAA